MFVIANNIAKSAHKLYRRIHITCVLQKFRKHAYSGQEMGNYLNYTYDEFFISGQVTCKKTMISQRDF